ncbi:MAG: proton-conducting transporter membrane subunit [Nitrososphaerota archaeon]
MMILQPIIVLLGAAAIIPLIDLLGKKIGFEKIRDIVAIAAFLTAFIILYSFFGNLPQSFTIDPYGPPLGVELRVDNLSLYMAIIFCGLGLLVSIYSIKYMEVDSGLDKYYSLLLILVAGMIGVAFSNDFFNLYVFWEMMCVASYTLVSFRKYKWEPVEAGFKYLVMSTIGSLISLYGISLLYGLVGSLNFTKLHSAIETIYRNGSAPLSLLYLVICMIIVGFGVTAAMVPLHTWLPDAHPAAPSSISAMLSGVVIKTGVYAMFRSLFTIFQPKIFDFGTFLMLFGVLTITIANFMALMQKDIKRLLAYSSIVNIGYILVGGGIGAYVLTHYGLKEASIAGIAIIGSLLHILNHAISKGLLFLCSGCFTHEAKTRAISKLEGIGKKMPLSGLSLSIGLFNLAGIPPLSGFWSKLFIILASLSIPENNFMLAISIIVILNSIFAASYYLWLTQRIMLKKPTEIVEKVHEAPLSMVFPIIVLAILCILITIKLDLFIKIVELASDNLLGGV